MFYKVKIKIQGQFGPEEEYVLVEADNIRTARNLATERIIEVEKATELELVTAGREGWPIIRASSETTTDDGQQPLELPTPHAQTADTAESAFTNESAFSNDTFGMPRSLRITGLEEPRQLSTGSAPPWLPPVNAPATDTGD